VNTAPESTAPFSCLIVDDDDGFASMMTQVVRSEGGEPVWAGSIEAARQQIAHRSFDLAILDNRLPDGTGYEFYPQLIRQSPSTVAVMITGAPELAHAVELTRNGLFDYLTKPISVPDFQACLRRTKQRLHRPEIDAATQELVGSSAVMRDVALLLQQAARHPEATVLLLGETGSGKDVAARTLHRLTHGSADAKPYVALNCSAVPAEMFEAELFGSEKGSYTGADRRRAGLVEAAEGGTLFLDEVAEVPLAQQAKLLRFLEAREYRALGATASRIFSGRIVAATHRNLADEVRAGRFRDDLMYRLDVFGIRLPPLRERLSDIPGIADRLLGQLCEKYRRRKPLLQDADIAALQTHQFPGNVRELRNLLERSLLRTEENATWISIDLGWLRGRPSASSPVIPTPPVAPAAPFAAPFAAPVNGSASAAESPPAPGRTLSPLDLQEYRFIQKVMIEEKGGIRRAASKLGITHQALLRRLQKWPELRVNGTSGDVAAS